MSTPVRRSLYVLVLALILAAAVYYLLEYLDDSDTQETETSQPAPADDPSGFSTDAIVADITAQASKNLGAPVTVTCPERVELRRDYRMTCQMADAAGAPMPDVVVTITDPAAAKGARWSWRQAS